jgi:hypothetical protein
VDPADIPEPMLDPAEWKLLIDQLNAENETISFLLKAHLLSEYHVDRLLVDYLGEKREPLYRIGLRFAQNSCSPTPLHSCRKNAFAPCAL